MKTDTLILSIILLLMIPLICAYRVDAAETMELTQTEDHHIVELNSDQPYVAGFHVNTPDLETRERVLATAITVSFPSTDTSHFPSDSWLGGGMFVQGQDSKLRFVDYGFYTMLVLDAEGNFFLDIGLHQTREETPPFHMPTEQLLYAYTWQIEGIDPATPVSLCATWDTEGMVHYSISVPEFSIALPPVNATGFPGCESLIRKFYAGNVIIDPFPFSRYIQYFQFGVVSSRSISNNHWSVDLEEPRLRRETGWDFVDTAWSIEGDISYLDYSWMWGGSPYHGVSAHYHGNPLENPHEVIFFYSGQTLPTGTILWHHENPGFGIIATDCSAMTQNASQAISNHVLPISILIPTLLGCTPASLAPQKRTHKHENRKGKGKTYKTPLQAEKLSGFTADSGLCCDIFLLRVPSLSTWYCLV